MLFSNSGTVLFHFANRSSSSLMMVPSGAQCFAASSLMASLSTDAFIASERACPRLFSSCSSCDNGEPPFCGLSVFVSMEGLLISGTERIGNQTPVGDRAAFIPLDQNRPTRHAVGSFDWRPFVHTACLVGWEHVASRQLLFQVFQ